MDPRTQPAKWILYHVASRSYAYSKTTCVHAKKWVFVKNKASQLIFGSWDFLHNTVGIDEKRDFLMSSLLGVSMKVIAFHAHMLEYFWFVGSQGIRPLSDSSNHLSRLTSTKTTRSWDYPPSGSNKYIPEQPQPVPPYIVSAGSCTLLKILTLRLSHSNFQSTRYSFRKRNCWHIATNYPTWSPYYIHRATAQSVSIRLRRSRYWIRQTRRYLEGRKMRMKYGRKMVDSESLITW